MIEHDAHLAAAAVEQLPLAEHVAAQRRSAPRVLSARRIMSPTFVFSAAPPLSLPPDRRASRRSKPLCTLRRRPPRAAAVGAGAASGSAQPSEPRRPDDLRVPQGASSQPASSQPASSQPASSQPASSQPASSQPASDAAQQHSHSASSDDAAVSDVLSFAQLSQPAISIDPVKKVPTSLIDASGALQIDDGSLQAVPVLPRRLVRRRKKPLDIEFLKRQLRSGFDTGIGATVVLMLMFATWYWANTAFNVYNKQVLELFPYPLTCTVVQFAVAGAVMAATWLFRMKKPPKLNSFLFKAALPLACLHAVGFMLTNMSLGKVSVAFTHTVKSTEPFFSVALTPSILGDVPTWGILASLFPIVAGVGLASVADASFNWIGFLAAVGSNLALQGRNILSKRLMDVGDKNNNPKRKLQKPMSREEEDTLMSLDNVNLFSAMSILAFFVLLPVSLLWEGVPLFGAALALPAGLPAARLYTMLIMGGICRCVDVLISYMILKRVSAVTHSVGNCVKRAVVIVASIFFFKTKVTILSIVGTTMALLGVLFYSLIVSACKQNSFGPDSPFCKPIYEIDELELTEGGGI